MIDLESAELKREVAWEPCGEVVNGQPCGKESTVTLETPAGRTIFRCTQHGIPMPSPSVQYQRRGFLEELRTESRFLWQGGIILAALYLLVRFVKWAWFRS